jgi:hypothetical protein
MILLQTLNINLNHASDTTVTPNTILVAPHFSPERDVETGVDLNPHFATGSGTGSDTKTLHGTPRLVSDPTNSCTIL